MVRPWEPRQFPDTAASSQQSQQHDQLASDRVQAIIIVLTGCAELHPRGTGNLWELLLLK